MMKGTLLKNRESLSYVCLLSDHGITDFKGSGFREQQAVFEMRPIMTKTFTDVSPYAEGIA